MAARTVLKTGEVWRTIWVHSGLKIGISCVNVPVSFHNEPWVVSGCVEFLPSLECSTQLTFKVSWHKHRTFYEETYRYRTVMQSPPACREGAWCRGILQNLQMFLGRWILRCSWVKSNILMFLPGIPRSPSASVWPSYPQRKDSVHTKPLLMGFLDVLEIQNVPELRSLSPPEAWDLALSGNLETDRVPLLAGKGSGVENESARSWCSWRVRCSWSKECRLWCSWLPTSKSV